MSLAQLKILQEVITLMVFVPFVVLYMKQPLRLDFSLGGALHPWRCVLHVSVARSILSARLSTLIRELTT